MQRGVLTYIEAYDPGIFPQDAVERFGIPPKKIVNLASNESPHPPPKAVLQVMKSALHDINRYPDPKYRSLKKGLSDYLCQPVPNIAVGNGSTEIFDMVCKVFLDPFDRVAMISPSYTMYALMGMIREATIEFVQTDDHGFQLNADFLLERAADAKIIFLCSPNNPTGMVIDRKQLERIIDEAQGIVVLDEAYIEFSGRSSIDLVANHPNLIVVRSMSKFFSLAGLRIGYAIADESVVEALEKTRLPFSISSVAEAAAVAALKHMEHYAMIRDRILAERERVFHALSGMEGMHPWASDANFILVKVERSIPGLVDRLCKMAVIVRDLKGLPGLDGDYIRVTIGTKKENDTFLRSLCSIIQ